MMATHQITHHVLFDQPGKRLARAICGRLVDRNTDHETVPSCEDCQRLLADRDAFDLNTIDPNDNEAMHDHI